MLVKRGVSKWYDIRSWFSRGVQHREKPRGQQPQTPRTGGVWTLPSRSAMSVAAVYRCVTLLSNSVAQLPLRYLRKRGGLFVPDDTSVLTYLLGVQPNAAMSAFDFWAQVVANVLLDGNAYIVPVYSTASMDVDHFVLCRRGSVQHDAQRDIYTVTDDELGSMVEYAERDIIHVKGYTLDGKQGVSVLTYAARTLDIAHVSEDETLDRFSNGGNVRGIIGNDRSAIGFGEYQDEELQKTAADIDGRFRNGERIVSVPGQAAFTQLSMSSADMQFLESRKFTVRDVCRFFGVHPSFVFDDTANNYKSAEMANVAFLSNTLNPLLRRIELELLRKLVPQGIVKSRRFEFDRRELYACDLESRVKYQQASIAAGLYTVNEWRAEENRPAVAGGDTVLVSANLLPLGETNRDKSDENGEE